LGLFLSLGQPRALVVGVPDVNVDLKQSGHHDSKDDDANQHLNESPTSLPHIPPSMRLVAILIEKELCKQDVVTTIDLNVEFSTVYVVPVPWSTGES